MGTPIKNFGSMERERTMNTRLNTRISVIALRALFVIGIAVFFIISELLAIPVYSKSPTDVLSENLVYLPLVLNRFPFIPDVPELYAISNDDGDGDYLVSWSMSEGATAYTMQEATNIDFSNATTAYVGPNTSKSFSGKDVGTYHYRVRASTAETNSDWSNVQVTTVLPPMAEVSVENDTGGQLCYQVDNTGIGQKCFSSGTHYYGTFPAGTYTWRASANCGSASGSRNYEPGVYTHRFWCQ
jgi:hypothetical protein